MRKSKINIIVIILLPALLLLISLLSKTILSQPQVDYSTKVTKEREILVADQGRTIQNPCRETSEKKLTSCVTDFLKTSKDGVAGGSLLGYYLLLSQNPIEQKQKYLRELIQDPIIKNNCYSSFMRAGKYASLIMGEKASIYSSPLCRSTFQVGVIQGLQGRISKEKSLSLMSVLCDLDPEKNGCADAVGRLVYEYGYTFADASKACVHTDTISAKLEFFYEGCVGGFANWSRYADFFKGYTSIQDVRPKYCANIDERGFLPCMGYGMRSYVRSGLIIGGYQEKLDEFYNQCMVIKEESIQPFCSGYLGYTISDVYNDRNGGAPILQGKALALKVDHYCQDNESCLENFVSWYTNQWAFNLDGELNLKGATQVCQNLLIANTTKCQAVIESSLERYNKRLIKAAQE